jgi:murein DD-endopeptidase MepM/ murein hydrolase activator NlpD
MAAPLFSLLLASIAIVAFAGPSGQERVFGAPVATPPISSCGYASNTCARTGRYHTGIDYRRPVTGTAAVLATNRGTVARLETMSPNDQGMGTNVILEHELESGGKVYSSYSHLASLAPGLKVGAPVAKGQVLGTMGGSGYGQADYWGVHLHFEIKNAPVPYSPSGGGTYWGYTPSRPENFGYRDPGAFIGRVPVNNLPKR